MPSAFHVAPLAGLVLRCQPDARLVTLCREGQERAFEEIVRRYRPPLVRFAAAIVPAHRAEDVVQEALTKAHSSLATTDAEISVKPWLYTIVRNRALNDLRDEPAHHPLEEDLDGVPQPPEVAAQRSELAAVLARIGRLPPAQREALVRRELEGRSHQEIAGAIGVSPGAVRGLIFRARAALRDAAGALIPLPAVRALLNGGPVGAESTGAAVGGAAAGLGAGAGGGLAVKAGTALLVAGLAVGSGVALHDRGGKQEATAATIARSGGPGEQQGQTGSRPGAAHGSGRSGQSGTSGRGGADLGAGSSDRGDHSGSSSSGPGSSGSEAGSSRGHEDGRHHGGEGDDPPGEQTSEGGHEGSDDSQHVGGEHEGGGETSGGETGSSDEGQHTSGESGGSDDGGSSGEETSDSHDVTGHTSADGEASSEQ